MKKVQGEGELDKLIAAGEIESVTQGKSKDILPF